MTMAPMPRSRLYTTAAMYGTALAALTLGREDEGAVARLEAAIAARMGVAEAVAMPQARVGIYFMLKHLIRPGQEVILSPYTVADVINMVICAGGIPVFVDIDRETCNLSAALVEAAITPKTGAVLATHFYGLACDIEAIKAICDRHGLPLIEDCAQAYGCRVGGRPVGSFGMAGVFSFGVLKNITSFMGGMVYSDNAELTRFLRDAVASLSPLPASVLAKKVVGGLLKDLLTYPPLFRLLTYPVFRYAYLNDINAINSRLKIDENPQLKTAIPDSYLRRYRPFQAELVLGQMDGVDGATAIRIEAAKRYHEILSDCPGLILPPLRMDGSHIYTYYPIQYADRDGLAKAVTRAGRDVQVSHHRNCASLECFQAYARPCPNAELTSQTLIYLPTYPGYGMGEVEATAQAVRAFAMDRGCP